MPIRTNISRPDEVIPASNLKAWLRTWSNVVSSGIDYLNDNFTLSFVNQTGTVSITAGTTSIVGTGTNFNSSDIGRRIRIAGQDRWISSVTSTTSATVNAVWLNEGNWTAAATNAAYAYGFINVWKDQSGNNNHAVHNGIYKPSLFMDPATSLIYAKGTGTADGLATPLVLNSPWCVFVSYRYSTSDASSGGAIFGSSGGNALPNDVAGFYRGEIKLALFAGNHLSYAAAPLDGLYFSNISFCLNGANSFIRYNGKRAVTGSAGGLTQLTGMSVLWESIGGVSGCRGSLSELIATDFVPATAQSMAVEHYIKMKNKLSQLP